MYLKLNKIPNLKSCMTCKVQIKYHFCNNITVMAEVGAGNAAISILNVT